MKLILRAQVGKYQDPILDFFDSRNFKIEPLDSPTWSIEAPNLRKQPAAVLLYEKGGEIYMGECLGWDPSLLPDTVAILLDELTKEVTSGNLSKLPELADTYISFEKSLEKH